MWSACCAAKAKKCTAEEFLEAVWSHIKSRPPIGEIAIRRGVLTMPQVREILKLQGELSIPFGEAAQKLGYLSKAQVDLLLVEQQNISTPVEDYLVAMGIAETEIFSASYGERNQSRGMIRGRIESVLACSERLARSPRPRSMAHSSSKSRSQNDQPVEVMA